jgi:hypothetical protein
MISLARSVYLDSRFGVEEELPHAGSALENPFVFDAIAQEMKAMASEGLIEITGMHTRKNNDEPLIDRVVFRRLR